MKIDICEASKMHLDEVLSWMRNQRERGLITFDCNSNVIMDSFNDHGIWVAIDINTNSTIGYLLHSFGILEVKAEHRGQGIGSHLVKHGIAELKNEGAYGIDIECAPTSSIPFWDKQGFFFYQDNRAFLLLNRANCNYLNPTGPNVVINVYPEERLCHGSHCLPVFSHEMASFRDDHESIELERIVCFPQIRELYDGDPVIEILLDDERVHLSKAKYQDSVKIGVDYRMGFWGISRIIGPA